jgi:predicted secreted hydrolase
MTLPTNFRRGCSWALLLLVVVALVGDNSRAKAQTAPINVLADRGAAPEPVQLPADDGAHRGVFVEWWQWWLHLETAKGRRFGATVTFFHAPLDDVISSGPFGVRRTDFRITDVRAGVAPSGSRYGPNSVSYLPGAFDLAAGGQSAAGGGGVDLLHIAAGDYVVDVRTRAQREPVPLFDPRGYFRYDAAQTVRIYERHRMKAAGTVQIGDRKLKVRGTSWFEHGWGNIPSVLHMSWDFFQLELDDGRDIQLAEVRDGPGGPVFLEQGVITARSGRRTYLGPGDFEIVPTGTWRRDATCTYPSGWRLRVKRRWFTVTPDVVDQEIRSDVLPVLWDGNTTITGASRGRGVAEFLNYCQTAPLAPGEVG